MERFVTLLLENPLFLVIAVILSVAVLLLFLKKILKLIVVVAAAGILYIAYLHWSGEDIPEVVKNLQHVVDEALERGAELLRKLAEPNQSG